MRRRERVSPLLFLLIVLAVPLQANASTQDSALCGNVGANAVYSCELWRSRYGGDAGSLDFPVSTVNSPDGSKVFVTGYSVGDASRPLILAYDIATLAYDASTGVELWKVRYDGPGNAFDAATDLRVSPDGSTVYISGRSDGGATGSDLVMIAYDSASGTQRWITRSDFSQYEDSYRGMTLSPDGSRIFLAATVYNSVTGWDFNTVAYDAANGAKVWASQYAGPGQAGYNQDGGLTGAITTSSDGTRVYVTGESAGINHSADYATVAYEATTGAEHWVARYSGRSGGNDLPHAVVVSGDGKRVYVTGAADGNVFPSTSWDYTTISYDADTGTAIWVQRFQGPADFLWGAGILEVPGVLTAFNASGDLANSMVISPDGKTLFVTGYSTLIGVANYDFATVAYDATTGENLWTTRYDGPVHGNDYPAGLAISADGTRVYVAGTSAGAGSSDLATIAYNAATGRPVWTARLDGYGGGDSAAALAISPDGSRLFVTGASDGGVGGTQRFGVAGVGNFATGPGVDYLTVAYNTLGPTALTPIGPLPQ